MGRTDSVRLVDVAEVIRSKNSGPYELTLDIIFRDEETFRRVCQAQAVNKELIANLYHIPVEKVINVIEFKPAKAIKATLERPLASGALGETDVYGAQQHAPLLDLVLKLGGA
ncbi:MAG TPA: DUF4387 domain-containing protein [Bacillota bacterium]|nr:DUF4387 domain-containing protein [Bacillota bacterium]